MSLRTRQSIRACTAIILLGVACSIFQAWGSIYYLTFHHRLNQGMTAFIPERLYPTTEWSNGWNEVGQSSLSIGYHRREFPLRITTISGNSAIFPAEERLAAWSGRPLGSVNPDPAGPSPTWSTPSRISRREMTGDEQFFSFHDIAAGWPFRSFWGSRRLDGNYEHYWSIPLGVQSAVEHNDPLLPYRPMPGLIPNAAIYGTVAYALLTLTHRAVIGVRTGLRRRRGRCTRCAYQIDALSICPECGTTSTKARPAPRR